MDLQQAKTLSAVIGDTLAEQAAATEAALADIRAKFAGSEMSDSDIDKMSDELFNSVKGYIERSIKPLGARIAALEAEAEVRKAIGR